MDTLEEALFTCEACGKQFPPEPDTVCAAFIDLQVPPGEEDNQEIIEDLESTRQFLQYADPEQIEEAGFTEKERQDLLAGKSVEKGAMIICFECQDNGCHSPDCPCNPKNL